MLVRWVEMGAEIDFVGFGDSCVVIGIGRRIRMSGITGCSLASFIIKK